MSQFQTSKSDLTQTRLIETSEASLGENAIRLNIERFSFTANNITYAVLGNAFKYWQFFPAAPADQSAWGMIPVWGFAKVVESNADDIKIGERFFGYFPPADTLDMIPNRVSKQGFTDASEHRANLPATYNHYRRVMPDLRDGDNELILLYPLHITAFSIHTMLQNNHWYGAEQIVIISASSKTSTGLAYALEEDDSAPTVIGLTSLRNVELVNNIGVYDEVMTYDDLYDIDASKATVIIDMSANGELLGKLHRHLGENMRFCSNVGLTHWGDTKPSDDFNAQRSEQFFAPTYLMELINNVGHEAYEKTSTAFVTRTANKCKHWLKMSELDGLSGLAARYPDLCDGKVAANEGLIVVLD